MLNVTMNNEKNGIEIRFNSKPEAEVLDSLKANGFRWSRKQKMWYAKQDQGRIAFVNTLNEKNIFADSEEVKQNKSEYNLWELTRMDNIPNHYEEEKLYDTKEIAKRIRMHLRNRFPMCKWSVTSDRQSIDVRMKSAPWESESDMIKAIAEYAYRYTDSYNYNDSDYMSDYHDVNFYGSYHPYNITDWCYFEKREEETVSEMNIREQFEEDMAEWQIAEAEREAIEREEMRIQAEKDRIEYEKRQKIREENREEIEKNVFVEDVDNEYFVLNLRENVINKLDSVDGYENLDAKEYEWHRTDAKVCRNVYMSKRIYDLFCNQLLDDYSFLEHMGGSETQDNRIESMTDYQMMDKEERNTVEWYSCKCVAIWCEGDLMMVIDPQGYSYARYAFFVDDETNWNGDYKYDQILSDKEKADNKMMADILEDVSFNIIEENNLIGVWDNEKFDEYKEKMKQWIYSESHHFRFDVGVVRAIEIESLKVAMYKLLTEMNGVQEQFRMSGLREGEKITIVNVDSWIGGLSAIKCTYKGFECGKYAQYDDSVKLIIRPENKRKDHYMWIHSHIIIYRGWLDVPKDLLWETLDGGRIQKSRFMSFDNQQYDVVLNHFKKQEILPVINTYKPNF